MDLTAMFSLLLFVSVVGFVFSGLIIFDYEPTKDRVRKVEV